MNTRAVPLVYTVVLAAVASALCAQAPGARDLFLADAAGKRPGAGPLGLRYALLKKSPDSRFVEVAADSVFVAGDAIRLSFELSRAAHVYIVQHGSSGRWNVLFASEGELAAGKRHELPARGGFGFDGHPGDERLYIVVSRQPEPRLDERKDLDRWLTGQQNSRDLVRQDIDDDSPGGIEKAVYIINSSQASDSRLIVPVSLKHR